MGNAAGKESGSVGQQSPRMNHIDAITREILISSSNINHGTSNHHELLHNSGYGMSKKVREKDLERIKIKTKHMIALVVKMEEYVDGGYLAPYGNYKYELDYDTDIVRGLILRRKLAPFFTPLEEFDGDWSDSELISYLRKNLNLHVDVKKEDLVDSFEDPNDHKLSVSQKSLKRRESKLRRLKLKEKTLELQNLENEKFKKLINETVEDVEFIPNDELLLKVYRDCEECPICFLHYPKKFNKTTCCGQYICSECFVQLKRADPHFPHDEESNTDSETDPEKLISEVVKCPFCAFDNFTISYEAEPGFRVGLDTDIKPNSFTSSNVKVDEKPSIPKLIGVDDIRPDWEQKLFSARSRMARRSAAATAMHATSLITEEDDYDDTLRGSFLTSQRRRSSRTSRSQRQQAEQLEQLMIEETIRLSLLDEEERQRREKAKARVQG